LRLVLSFPLSVWLWEACVFFTFLVSAPLFIGLYLTRLAWTYRRRLVNPLGGLAHLLVASAALLLCPSCRSRRPAQALFIVHGCFLAVGLLERATMRRLPWRHGKSWWLSLLVAVQVTSLTLDRRWITLLLLLLALRMLQRVSTELALTQGLMHGTIGASTLLVCSEAWSMVLSKTRGGPMRVPMRVPWGPCVSTLAYGYCC